MRSVNLAFFLVLIKLHVVLLQTMESEFALILDQHFNRVRLELLTSELDVAKKGDQVSNPKPQNLIICHAYLLLKKIKFHSIILFAEKSFF